MCALSQVMGVVVESDGYIDVLDTHYSYVERRVPDWLVDSVNELITNFLLEHNYVDK